MEAIESSSMIQSRPDSHQVALEGGMLNIHGLMIGTLGGAAFGFMISLWNRKQACEGTVCRLNGDAKVATVSYAIIGAFLGATFNA